MDNKSKSDRIHELLPALLNSQQDQNWSTLIEAIGQEDDRLAALIEQVRLQFFVKTASRPYLDKLAANCNITRPKFVGMSDGDFRTYIPVMSYQPKQVKNIIDVLLDLFFLKEATTAFLSSGLHEPFALKSNSTLNLKVDNVYQEKIKFTAADFSNIDTASVDEVAAAYNRQAKFSYATRFYDSVTKQTHLRIFTNTIGAQGALEIEGGLANIGLHLNGFILNAGTGSNTQWTVTKIGDAATFTYSAGALPGIDKLEVGDIFLCDLPGNEGSFVITAINVQNASFSFTNLFATIGVFSQNSTDQVRFLRPEKIVAYRNVRRALAWETQSGKISVELPTTPSIVRRGIKGGFHINGTSSKVKGISSKTTLEVVDASKFPLSGQFVLEPVTGITARLTGNAADEVVTRTNNGRLISNLVRYSYSGIDGNTLTNITPNLPTTTQLHESTISSLVKSNGVVTCTTGGHDFKVGEQVILRNNSGIELFSIMLNRKINSPILEGASPLNGVAPNQLISGNGIPVGARVLKVISPFAIIISKPAFSSGIDLVSISEDTNGAFNVETVSNTSFSFKQLGIDGMATTPGTAAVERTELSKAGSTVIVTTSQSASTTKLIGPYVWDPQAPFVLSSHTAKTVNVITAGKQIKLLDVTENTIPDENGYIIFDYGQNNQEGPVRYTYKPTANILAIDPSYIFQHNHAVNCSVIALNHKGPHTLSGRGDEYPPYLTNPGDARLIIQELIKSVASAGIFVDFLVHYPVHLYGTLSVYD